MRTLGLRKQCKESLVVVVVSVFMLSLLSSVLMLMLPPEFVGGAVSNRKLGDANCSALKYEHVPRGSLSWTGNCMGMGTGCLIGLPKQSKESYLPLEPVDGSSSHFDHLILL